MTFITYRAVQKSQTGSVPRRTVSYRPTKALAKVRPELAEPIKALIEQESSFGYRTVAGLLGTRTPCSGSSSSGWQVRKRAISHRPRIEALGTLGRVTKPFPLRSDNGLVFTSHHHTRVVRSYGLKQEFVTPHCPQQNGLVERAIQTLKEKFLHRHCFETQQHAMRIIADSIQFYNHRRPR